MNSGTCTNPGIIIVIFAQVKGSDTEGRSSCSVSINGTTVITDGQDYGNAGARISGSRTVKKGDVISSYVERGGQNPSWIVLYVYS